VRGKQGEESEGWDVGVGSTAPVKGARKGFELREGWLRFRVREVRRHGGWMDERQVVIAMRC
jgi:hypothetical protein